MFYSVQYAPVDLVIGVAALLVGGVHFFVGTHDLILSRFRNLQGWRHLVLGILFIAAGRFMCFRAFRLT